MEEPSDTMQTNTPSRINNQIFSGNIYIFHAFDVGDDINLEKVEQLRAIKTVPLALPKYFKNYHMPLAIELPHPHDSTRCMSCKMHNFGAISLTYKIPFKDTLENVRKQFNELHNQYLEQSVSDVASVFKKIKKHITQPNFFQTRSYYIIIQVDPEPGKIEPAKLRENYGSIIASTLRFEIESLSEDQKNEILESAIGYYRGDMIIVDTDVSFVYDAEYEKILDFFEFANIQQLELRYFDRLLDHKLNKIYESEGRRRLPISTYLPFIDIFASDPVTDLGKLKADISVITERLEGSIKLAGEPYFSELYTLLVEKLDLKNWQNAIERKLNIIRDIQSIYQHKTDVARENVLSVLIVILIFIELIVGILSYLK